MVGLKVLLLWIVYNYGGVKWRLSYNWLSNEASLCI